MIITTILPRLVKRSGTRLLLSFSSLIIGALTLAIVLGLIGSVQRFFVAESRTLLGGDVTIEDDKAIDKGNPLLTTLIEQGGKLSSRVDTLVVVRTGNASDSTNEKVEHSSLLVTLKVVDNEYPLYGKLGLYRAQPVTPGVDEAFIAEDVIARLSVNIGDSLFIGDRKFTIANVIVSEPDRVAGSFRLGPLVMIDTAGWASTGLDGKQSRVDHILSVRYPSNFTTKEVENTNLLIRDAFPRPQFRVADAADGPSSLLRILDAAERFFFSMIVLALFLVVVNIRLNLTYFLASFQKTIAIMRSLGMRRSQLFLLFLSLLLTMATLAGILGALLGNVLANSALPFAERFIESSLPSIPITENIAIVTIFTFVLCLLSALGFLIRVLAIEPKMLLLGYGSEHGRFSLLVKELPTLLLSLTGFYIGVYYLTERWLVALIAVGSITAIFATLFILSRTAVSLGHRSRFAFSFPIRAIMNFLKHQGLIGTTAIASLTIALASVFAIALLEKNVLGNLSTEFKADAPNIYLIDVQQDQLPGIREIMGSTWKDFSMVRARFSMRDGYDIQANLNTEDRELRREFNVTSASALIDGERLVEGTWHGTDGRKQVSVEKDFAERAKLKLGSNVVFTVQGFPIEATVTSIREVNTTSGLPFFFLVFSPDVLEGIPRTSFGYAYSPVKQIPELQAKLSRTFPNVTSIPTTQIIDAARKIIAALSAAVIATAVPALFLGLILIIAMLAISARERANDMLVFTAYGARMRLLFKLFLIESSMVVLIAGVFATLISHIGVYALNHYVFDFTGFYLASENAYLFIAIIFVTLIIAYLFARRFVSLSPAELLRKEGM